MRPSNALARADASAPAESIGRSGLQVAPFGLGGNVFGWTIDESRSFEILDAFVEAGFQLIDTADVYSRWVPGNVGGESEAIIGRWLRRAGRGVRERVVIATKGGQDMGQGRKGLSARYLPSAVAASLDRLQTDYIDLYQPHRDEPDTPLAETLAALSELKAAGRIRALGASNYSAPRLAEALALSHDCGFARFEALQTQYNLYDRAEFETTLAPLCRSHGLAVLPYYALASGFLTGKYRDAADQAVSLRGPRVIRMLDARGHRILAALDAVSAALGATAAQVALAWLRSRGTIPLASATSPAQLRELLESTRLHLDPAHRERLEAASAV